MRKVFAYMRPYFGGILCCFAFLFVQSFCELSLPNYMSNIVNIGIQQGGIEDTVPGAMSEKFYNLLKLFMSDSEQELFDKNYNLITTNKKVSDYEHYVEKYPLLKKENIYVFSTKEHNNISSEFNSVCHTMINFLKLYFPNYNISLKNSYENIDFSKIYQLVPQIKNTPAEVFDELRKNKLPSNQELTEQTSIYIIKEIYKELEMDTNKLQNNYIFKIGLIMLTLALISCFASLVVNYLASKISTKTAKNLRHDVFRKVESFSNNEFNKFSTASLITRTTNDITQIQNLIIMSVRILFYAPITAIGGIIMALQKSASMYWTIILGTTILIILIVGIFVIVFPKFRVVQRLVDKFNLVTKENLTGIMVIRAFGTQNFEEKRFDDANKKLMQTELFTNRVMALMMPAMMLLMNLVSILIIWTGSHKIENAQMQVGDMIAFMQYAMQVIMSFLMISAIFIIFPRSAVSLKRVAEVLETEPEIKDNLNIHKIKKSQIKGNIEFKHVCFKYDDAKENLLEDINFVALPGKITAFIGPTGSGKSTLINLIPRFFDVTSGEILIDGLNIKDLSQKDLHDIIAYVPQKGMLFSGDIESNLKFGDANASEKDLKLAADIAQASEFIEANNDGFKRKISENGSNVSGGQRQRLSIARAILKNAPIYIFDDSFSALDLKTDAALRKALYQHTKNNTILVVAQRINTIINADQIIVLNDGKIVGIGTHKDLIKICETYRDIALSQLPKESLV